jgi:hypothetical protein
LVSTCCGLPMRVALLRRHAGPVSRFGGYVCNLYYQTIMASVVSMVGKSPAALTLDVTRCRKINRQQQLLQRSDTDEDRLRESTPVRFREPRRAGRTCCTHGPAIAGSGLHRCVSEGALACAAYHWGRMGLRQVVVGCRTMIPILLILHQWWLFAGTLQQR